MRWSGTNWRRSRAIPTRKYALGWMYENGYGVEQNYEQAASWYDEAVMQGQPAAFYRRGVLLENGWGVEQDTGEAYNDLFDCGRNAK